MKSEEINIIAEVDEKTQPYQSSVSAKYIPAGYKLRSHTRVYEIIKCLGHGTFGITYLAKDNNNNIVAIKEFFMHQFCGRDVSTMAVTGSSSGNQIEYYGEKFKKEALNLKKLNQKSIVNIIEAFESNNTYYYSMEYIEGMTLDDYILSKGGLQEEEAIGYIWEISKAIKHIHDQRMLHLDLKPKNIMRRPDGSIVVIDFGLSKQFDDKGEAESSSNVGLGTPGYAPTEQVEHNGKLFAPWLDIYALGGVLFKMLTAKTPPPASEVLNTGLPLVDLKKRGTSKKTLTLLKNMMNPLWKQRIASVDNLLKQLPLSKRQKEAKSRQKYERIEIVLFKINTAIFCIISIALFFFTLDFANKGKLCKPSYGDWNYFLYVAGWLFWFFISLIILPLIAMSPFAIHKNVELKKATFIQLILTLLLTCSVVYVANIWVIPSKKNILIDVSSHPDDCTCDECIQNGVYLKFGGFDENGDSVFVVTKEVQPPTLRVVKSIEESR